MSFAQRVLAATPVSANPVREIHKVAPILEKASGVKLNGDYGVGSDASSYSAMLPADQAKKVVAKLVKAFKFKAAVKSRQDPPVAGTAGTKAYISWAPELCSPDGSSWATRMLVIPEKEHVRLYFRISVFKK